MVEGGAVHIQTSAPTSFPRVLLVRIGHMIAADCLGAGKCGLCLDSQVSAYSSRVKERENFNKHEIQVLVSLAMAAVCLEDLVPQQSFNRE